ncbi:ABC transporter ATP-binding protein [Flaviflagellibacter deserti]|uniref:ABC transporter ATP-binding protein n=1 Tax=Flaviflagellibacter deserti TaxID=2267266 RepID=A0ABV9Z277_9HYPH
MTKHLRISGVSKSFPTRQVLHGIDLDVPRGTVLALLGPSGSGKSTLLRLIAGFERVDAGEIVIDGGVVASTRTFVPPEKRRVGYVPQDGALFPHLTVRGNVGYGLPRAERKSKRVDEMLSLVGLDEFADRYPRELSGGQQQRVALARALAPASGLILLDEPFNALDLELRRTVSEEVIALLRQTGTTAIFVTHDPGEAFGAADLVAVMQDGRIMQCDTPSEVYGSPENAVVARLTGTANLLEGVVRGSVIETPLGTFEVRNGVLDGRAVAMLRPEQIAIGGSGVEAKVIARRFRGDHTTLVVQGQDFTATVRAPGHVAGDIVRLSADCDCVAFDAP